MRNRLTSVLAIVALGIAIGCGSLNSSTTSERAILRQAEGITAAFDAPAGATLGNNSCLSPMVDPTDGTEVKMERAFGTGRGDYSVPEGKYGVQKGELLRINCRTGEVLGIVKE